LVYAGGIYLNRWKTLKEVVKALKEINSDGVKATLDIYTANILTKRQEKALNDNVNSFVHKSVSLDALKEIYENSDIAIHAEAFSLKNRLSVRMSFSTKIIDCLASGCAVMAICDKLQGGYEYLEREDAAICVSDTKMLKNTILGLINNPDKIIAYAQKARDLVKRNHLEEIISKSIKEDFLTVLNENEGN
jgi:UDP-N-acetylglucosamine:LPS N-acetylglucosamine transferase